MNKILAVKRKGKSPTFFEQKRAPNQAPPALVKHLGSQKKKWKGGKGNAQAHKIVSSALIPQAVAKRLQETHPGVTYTKATVPSLAQAFTGRSGSLACLLINEP